LKLQAFLDSGCKIEKVHPSVLGSDAEINIVTVEVKCSDGQIHKIRAYREEASDLREFIRTKISNTR
jgi:RecB family endonuclease NucS